MPVVDTLRLKNRLSESGMPESQAQVLVEELDEALSVAIMREVATKADVVELRSVVEALKESVEHRFANVEQRFADSYRLQLWIAGVMVSLLVGIGLRVFFM